MTFELNAKEGTTDGIGRRGTAQPDQGSAADAWRVIIDKPSRLRQATGGGQCPSEVTKRDREIGALDHFLSSSGWDLWQNLR